MNVALSPSTTPHSAHLSVGDFLLLRDNGAFDGYAKAELIEGEIICVNSQFSRHAMAKTDIAIALAAALKAIGSSLRVTVAVTVRLSDDSLPEPDLVVTSFREEGPVPGVAVMLAIEVSDTTLEYDLVRKARLYAANAISEYWVVDLEGRVVHQHSSPGAEGYGERREVLLGGVLNAETIIGLAIDTQGI